MIVDLYKYICVYVCLSVSMDDVSNLFLGVRCFCQSYIKRWVGKSFLMDKPRKEIRPANLYEQDTL